MQLVLHSKGHRHLGVTQTVYDIFGSIWKPSAPEHTGYDSDNLTFGAAKRVDAPEVYKHNTVHKSNVRAIGIMVFKMLAGVHPAS